MLSFICQRQDANAKKKNKGDREETVTRTDAIDKTHKVMLTETKHPPVAAPVIEEKI